MVIGHSGVPFSLINDFIYTFHMPLFFFCSGYFFKGINSKTNFKNYCAKRISSLYFPYLKWSFSFLIFHNVFYNLFIYSYSYNCYEFFKQGIKVIAMTEYEIMLRPFWFIKTLLLTSISAGLISFACYRKTKNLNTKNITLLSLIATLLLKYLHCNIPIIGDCSLILFGIAYYFSGSIYRHYEDRLRINAMMPAILLTIILVGCQFFTGIIDMRYTTELNTLFYYILSLLGIMSIFEIAKRINENGFKICKNVLYYIGNHTMPILALHLLFFKIVNLIKILIYDLPIERLADYTIIKEHNNLFWIIYVVFGLLLPLLSDYFYYSIKTYKRSNKL